MEREGLKTYTKEGTSVTDMRAGILFAHKYKPHKYTGSICVLTRHVEIMVAVFRLLIKFTDTYHIFPFY